MQPAVPQITRQGTARAAIATGNPRPANAHHRARIFFIGGGAYCILIPVSSSAIGVSTNYRKYHGILKMYRPPNAPKALICLLLPFTPDHRRDLVIANGWSSINTKPSFGSFRGAGQHTAPSSLSRRRHESTEGFRYRPSRLSSSRWNPSHQPVRWRGLPQHGL